MVMKDKLVKFGHKKAYYRMRQIMFGTLAAFCVFAMVAIPTYISINKEAKQSIAESNENVENQDKEIKIETF